MVGMIVKTIDLVIVMGVERLSPTDEAFQSGQFGRSRAFLVTKAWPDKNDGYHVVILSVESLQKEGAQNKIQIQGQLLDKDLKEAGNFEAKLKLVDGKWGGMAQFKTKRSFRPSSIIISSDLQ